MEAVINPPRTLMEVFKRLPEGTLAQLIENELVMSPAPKEIHQRILGKLFNALYNGIEKNNIGELRCAPYDVYLDNGNAYQPDIVFIANDNLRKIEEDGLHGVPDLIIEILSPGTAQYDKNKKKEVYERTGVKEYWIIDPFDNSAEGFFLEQQKFESLGKTNSMLASRLLKARFAF